MKSCFDLKIMKRAYSLKLGRYLVPAILLALLAGCLTSPNAFYNESDVVQDARFLGAFVSNDSGLKVKISGEEQSGKHYLLQLTEGGKTTDYTATLFKIKDSLFVDMIPKDENRVFERYSEGIPSASALLQQISHNGKVIASKRLHVLFRLSLSDKEIDCFGAKKAGDPSNPISKDSSIKVATNGDGLVLEAPTEALGNIVSRYAGTNWEQLFPNNGLVLTRTGP